MKEYCRLTAQKQDGFQSYQPVERLYLTNSSGFYTKTSFQRTNQRSKNSQFPATVSAPRSFPAAGFILPADFPAQAQAALLPRRKVRLPVELSRNRERRY